MPVLDPQLLEEALQHPWDRILESVRGVLESYPIVTQPTGGRIYVQRMNTLQAHELPCIVVTIQRDASPQLDSEAPKAYDVRVALTVEAMTAGADEKAAALARKIGHAAALALEANESLGGDVDRLLRTGREIAVDVEGDVAIASFLQTYDVRVVEPAINEANRSLLNPLVTISGKFEDEDKTLIEATALPPQT